MGGVRLAGRIWWAPTAPIPLVALQLTVLLGLLVYPGFSSSQTPTREETALLRQHSETVREAMKDLPPFLRDTRLALQLRTYYFLRGKPDGVEQEAWAAGGWLTYRSGWFLDVFGVGATLYGSAPIYAPDDRDGTLLLRPGQDGYIVLGEAFGALRYEDYALLKGYRQTVAQGYINPEDNRMTPNTFEGVTLGGKMGPLEYLGGYLWKMKARNSDDFRSMSKEAGAPGGDDGVALIGFKLAPLPGLSLNISEQYGVNTFNTVFAQVEYAYPFSDDLRLVFGGQFTDQRAVGDKLVRNSAFEDWETQTGSGKVALSYRDLTVTTGFSVTASGNTIQSPWGSYPGYFALIQEDFNRASEKAILAGLSYDFGKLITPGLGGFLNFAWGWDAIDPKTRTSAPNQAEYDCTIDYRPPMLEGLWFRLRGMLFDQQGGDHLGYQVRVTINWEIPLL